MITFEGYLIEEGLDKDGNPCFFILKDADFVGVFPTLHDAKNFIRYEKKIH